MAPQTFRFSVGALIGLGTLLGAVFGLGYAVLLAYLGWWGTVFPTSSLYMLIASAVGVVVGAVLGGLLATMGMVIRQAREGHADREHWLVFSQVGATVLVTALAAILLAPGNLPPYSLTVHVAMAVVVALIAACGTWSRNASTSPTV
ncbi:hypothetical protein [Microbacterium marinilacus]|uniref:Major facilitator superfamily (MFS) profile domain-containing protein n=1 Tax=Microbacterium marinilacus TaxID=415209 RepID=A0ABP7BMM4_9MICO|nr:hypothetical protein [Microbacterium marinilacus]MBY0690377.1 hypothetical protein [Microbacterium marinilacus]